MGRCSLPMIDGSGRAPSTSRGAGPPCRVVPGRYERRGAVFTTNTGFSRWGTALGDEKLAAATVDRVVTCGRLLEFGGASRRMEASLMLGRGEE